jgi:hypothetical protein
MEVAYKNGDLKKESENKKEVSALYEILKQLPKPEPGMKLNARQKKWWYWFGYEFVSTKQFCKGDLVILQQAAFWMDARCQAIDQINKKGYKGLVQTFASLATNVTGHVSILEKADKNLDMVSAHFGLSIKDRTKLKAVNEGIPANQLSLFDEVQAMLNSGVI